MIDTVIFSKTKQNLNIESLPDGAVIVFTTSPDSDFSKKQLKGFEDKFDDFQKQNVTVLFSSSKIINSKSGLFVQDLEEQFIKLVPDLQNQQESQDNLIIFTKKGNALTLSELKTLPENDYNWSETISNWVKNFNNPNLGKDGMWKWGQVSPKTADYLCVDCGYIEEIKEGQTFPICIVCLSGEVDGPSGPADEYWEEV